MKLLKLVPDNTNIDFMRWRNLALVLSIIATVASLALVAVRGLNLGVDFVGGQVVRTTFPEPIRVDQLRDRVNALGLGDANIQEFGGPRSYQIRLPKPEGGDAAASRAVTDMPANPSPARSARSWRAPAPWRSFWRCSASPSTSGSASNGSSAWARSSPYSTTCR
jgi:preprotein translocase subunit SecF